MVRGQKARPHGVFAILGEKHAERNVVPSERERKARIVFAGSVIQTASRCAPYELFQEVSSAPAAMASVRAVLAVAALRGWTPMVRHAAQAYMQDCMDAPGRPKMWVRLPKSMWPKSWTDSSGNPRFYDPVCLLQQGFVWTS